MSSTLLLKLTSEASLRGMVDDGLHVFAVYDFITISCDKKDNGSYARIIFGRLIADNSKYKDKILKLCSYVKFPGQGQRNTPTMTIEGLQMLLQILDCKVCEAFKQEASKILQRYLDGDTSMCAEIEENKAMGKAKSYQKFAQTVMKRAKDIADKEAEEMPPSSFVYATKSPAFEGLIKIGKTVDMQARLSSLNTGCAPAPHVVVAVAPTFDNTRDERMAHTFFADARKEGEFFKITEDQVKAYFQTHILAQYQVELAQHMARIAS